MTDNHILLYRLAELMFEHEQPMLPVDLLFDDVRIGNFAKSIQIDSPYQQMLLEGILTESVRDEKLFVSFTVEGYFQFVLGELIYKMSEGKSAKYLKIILKKNKLNGINEGVQQCLIKDIQEENLSRLSWFVNNNINNDNFILVPMIISLKLIGIQKTINSILEKQTDNNWGILISLNKELEIRQLVTIQHELTLFLLDKNPLESFAQLVWAILACGIVNYENSIYHLSKIEAFNINKKLRKSIKGGLHFLLGKMYLKSGYLNKAESHFINSIDINTKLLGITSQPVANCYSHLSTIYNALGEHDKSIEYSEKCLAVDMILNGSYNSSIASSYNHIGISFEKKREYTKAVEFHEKSLDIYLKTKGSFSREVSDCYNNLSVE